ncbi:MAG: hypothetical protein ACR2G6_10555 [Gemmatimonadaceae bacterium]
MLAPLMVAFADPGGESTGPAGWEGSAGVGSVTGGIASAGVAVGDGESVARGD